MGPLHSCPRPRACRRSCLARWSLAQVSEAARILPGEAMYGRLPADLRDVGSEARAPRPAPPPPY